MTNENQLKHFFWKKATEDDTKKIKMSIGIQVLTKDFTSYKSCKSLRKTK